jgi:hypothetical protein
MESVRVGALIVYVLDTRILARFLSLSRYFDALVACSDLPRNSPFASESFPGRLLPLQFSVTSANIF